MTEQEIEAAERIFEGLTDPSRLPIVPFRQVGLAIREEVWDRSFSVERVHRLGQQLADSNYVRLGVADQVRRAQILGLSHLFFLAAAPHEAEIRRIVEGR